MKYLLCFGEFRKCSWATLNYNCDISQVYCAKYHRIVDGEMVIRHCRGYGDCEGGGLGQCSWATLNYNGNPSLAYCAKYHKIMDGWTVSEYCRGNGGCDR